MIAVSVPMAVAMTLMVTVRVPFVAAMICVLRMIRSRGLVSTGMLTVLVGSTHEVPFFSSLHQEEF
ncbi:hypothetical protein ABRP87_05050 [Corynebacterium sp. KPL2830]|uniref:hypothetical protein n=1 Tax=Corynebacterium sp. KPL2830 TaxID=3158315 RepID=UPI0032F00DC6